MAQKLFYQQNDGHLPKKPPFYLGKMARNCWRKIVPFLESTKRVQRIDTYLVEQYCTQYEIYRLAYQEVQENGVQTKIYTSLQDSSGEVIGKDFVGYRKNPAVSTMNDANKQLNSIGIQLGLTPKGRQELMEIANTEKEESVGDMLKKSGLI